MRRINRTTAGIATAGLLLTLASCGGDDPNKGTEPTPSDPTTSTETTEPTPGEPTPGEPTPSEPATDEDKAAAALLGYLEVRDEAYATGRITKKLNKYATGREHFALQQFVQQLTTQARARIEGEWSHEVVRTKPSDGAILVSDCEDSEAVNIVSTKTGEVMPWFSYEGKEIPRRLVQTYRVVLNEDAWKVESQTDLPTKVRTC